MRRNLLDVIQAAQLLELAPSEVRRLVARQAIPFVDLNSEAVPLTLFGAAIAGKPYVPINYRLADDQLRAIVRRTAPAVVVAGEGVAERLGTIEGIEIVTRKEVLDVAADGQAA